MPLLSDGNRLKAVRVEGDLVIFPASEAGKPFGDEDHSCDIDGLDKDLLV